VGTGTGLAPYVSMLRSELACGGPRRFIVLQGARYSWDLGYRAELAVLARRCPNLIYIPVISRATGDPTWRGPIGHLQTRLFPGLHSAGGFGRRERSLPAAAGEAPCPTKESGWPTAF